MTRTQKLGLCTWLPEDPVCLAEVNDNFNRLDNSGARALRQAEAGLIALGGVMAAQAHQGGHAAYSDSIQADAFSDMEQVADYTGVYFLNQCGELLTEGVSDGTVFGNAADNAFNASGISRATQVTQTWVKLFSFYPDAYGTLSTLKLQSVATTGSTTTAVKLAIWDSATHESLLETELATMTRSGGTDDPITFNTPFLLDPNRKYDMMLWIESMAASTFTLKSIVFRVTPVIYQEGSVSLNARTIPAGCTHAEILLHASTETAQAALRFDSGEFTALTPTQTVSDKLPGGTRCTLLRYRVDIPGNAQTAQLKLTLPSQSCKIYDTALVLL